MSEWRKIRVKDFYKDAVGETEYAYVSKEVYEALADTFRKEAHAEQMRDLRHTTSDGYQTYDQGRIYRRRNGRPDGGSRGDAGG